eukprot:COSAG05_NODE_8938_length_660_cov_0.638146_2_plen_164_part_00
MARTRAAVFARADLWRCWAQHLRIQHTALLLRHPWCHGTTWRSDVQRAGVASDKSIRYALHDQCRPPVTLVASNPTWSLRASTNLPCRAALRCLYLPRQAPARRLSCTARATIPWVDRKQGLRRGEETRPAQALGPFLLEPSLAGSFSSYLAGLCGYCTFPMF